MNLDGFVIDSFKYAMDDWGYNFMGLKDYAYRGEGWFTNKNYYWWETQKSIDLFSVEGKFLSFFLKAKSPYIRPMGHGLLKKRPTTGKWPHGMDSPCMSSLLSKPIGISF